MFLDIKLGRYGEGTPLGRIIIELKARVAALRVAHCLARWLTLSLRVQADVCPKTATNFLQLCQNPEGSGFVNSR